MTTHRRAVGQMLLFPADPRSLAESLGLDWWAAKKLYDDKWLSFDPETSEIDTDDKEAEFVFLGSLVTAGCDPRMLKRLLENLQKPYCYGISKIYYDWSNRNWKDFPYSGSPDQVAAEIVSGFEEEGDEDSLVAIQVAVQEALGRLNGDDDPEGVALDIYQFNAKEDPIVDATRRLLWKIAGSSLVGSPPKTLAVGKLYAVIQRLPTVTRGESLDLSLVGPRRKYGDHEIYHWWDIALDEEGLLSVSSGGHFYRPQTGGDTFSTMSWEVAPGRRPELEDHLPTLAIVDDADTFEHEVQALNLEEPGYSLDVEDSTLDEQEVEDGEE